VDSYCIGPLLITNDEIRLAITVHISNSCKDWLGKSGEEFRHKQVAFIGYTILVAVFACAALNILDIRNAISIAIGSDARIATPQ